ncbi:MAG TPA: urease accessory protein UreF [Burkholderiaceae bacterium]|nr:urease accessory protein UreF [Burkholderiaceae bacterium]
MTARPASSLATTLALLQLASPALPVGGFAYSQGLEAAITDDTVRDAATARRWIVDALTLVLARLEAPLWLRVHDAACADDTRQVVRWNEELLATRETAELRAESLQMGASLARVFPALNLDPPDLESPTYTAVFAIACARLGITRDEGLAAYLWTWAENQVLVAVKTVPLGQQAAQAMLYALHPSMQQAIGTARALGDEELGTCAFGAVLHSARHETQYSRLFRS